MSDWVPLISAGIGALLGSLGGVLLKDRLDRRHDRERLRDQLVQRYLLQLQLDTESLLHRARNLTGEQGRGAMENREYFTTSMLYGLGAILAHKLLLQFQGVYSQLEQFRHGFGARLLSQLQTIDAIVAKLHPGGRFQHYSRLALAHAILARPGEVSGLRTYGDFAAELDGEGSTLRVSLSSAIETVNKIYEDASQTDVPLFELQGALERLGELISDDTGIPFPLSPDDDALRESE